MGLSYGYGPADEPGGRDQTHPCRRRARRNHFGDTAEAYGPFTVMRNSVGERVGPIREQVIIATKFGWNIEPRDRRTRPKQPSGTHQDRDRRPWPRAAQTDHIDLLYQHQVDSGRADRDIAGTMKRPDRGRKGHLLLAYPKPALGRPSDERTQVHPLDGDSKRVLDLDAGPRRRLLPACELEASWFNVSHCAVEPADRAFSQARSMPPRHSTNPTSAPCFPVSHRRRGRPTWLSSIS